MKINDRRAWGLMGGGGGDTASQYRSNVIRDGGSVTDYDYLKSRIQHAKDNGYYDSIVWWGSPSFGVKQSAGLTSKLYDVIDIDNNSLVSTIGSEQPEFISSAQNSKPTLRGDGIDDSLYTTHLNSILAAGREYVMLFIFKPITHNASSLRTYFQNKQEGVYDNCLRQSSASLNYDLVANRNSATNSNVSVKRLTGVANNSFSILAVNFRAKGAWTLNDQIGNYFNIGILNVPQGPLLLLTNTQVAIGSNYANANIEANVMFFIRSLNTTSATKAVSIQNSAATSLFNIWNDGNVGVNTNTNAGFKLDVNGTARIATSLVVGGTGSGSLTTSVVRCNFLNTSDNGFSVVQFQTLSGNATFFQSVSIGSGANPLASAQLEVASTTKVFLPPRMTNAQRTAIVSPAVGLIVYCTDVTEGLWVYKSTGWTFIV